MSVHWGNKLHNSVFCTMYNTLHRCLKMILKYIIFGDIFGRNWIKYLWANSIPLSSQAAYSPYRPNLRGFIINIVPYFLLDLDISIVSHCSTRFFWLLYDCDIELQRKSGKCGLWVCPYQAPLQGRSCCVCNMAPLTLNLSMTRHTLPVRYF